MADHFEIRLAIGAERALQSLPAEDRTFIRNVVEGIAEVAALSPPQFPEWFRRWGMSTPMFRVVVAGREISYELDCDSRSLRVCEIASVTREQAQHH